MIAVGISAIAYISVPLWVPVQVSLRVLTGNQGPRQPECAVGLDRCEAKKTGVPSTTSADAEQVAAISTLTEAKHFYLKVLFKGHGKGRRRIRTFLEYHINKSLCTTKETTYPFSSFQTPFYCCALRLEINWLMKWHLNIKFAFSLLHLSFSGSLIWNHKVILVIWKS